MELPKYKREYCCDECGLIDVYKRQIEDRTNILLTDRDLVFLFSILEI